MIKDNRKVFDEKVQPLIDEVFKICNEHKLPMLCTFQVSGDNDFLTTHTHVDGEEQVLELAVLMFTHGGNVTIVPMTEPMPSPEPDKTN